MPNLQQHLLHRILAKLHNPDNPIPDTKQHKCDYNKVLFKNDRIYRHNLLRINFTAYDVRRSQDVVNAATSHHNIMLLADPVSDHPFKYARVLGVYHANVLYVGHGALDYQTYHMEFLWVRWYENTGVTRDGWKNGKLDWVKFPSVAKKDSFGFIDPSEVLRSCHIIPRFREGKRHIDGKGLSLCAQDSGDWVQYYVNR